MMFVKKSYCFTGEKWISFAGHVKKETAMKRKFKSVSLVIIDTSGKGRSEQRHFYPPFEKMHSFN